MDVKRYIVRDLEYGNPVLIDRLKKSITYYEKNKHGQIYNLETPKRYIIDTRTINGLIRRHSRPYPKRGDTFDLERHSGIRNAIDSYIYAYLMSPEQQSKCPHKYRFDISDDMTPLVAETNDYTKAITKMCEWVYKKECEYRNKHSYKHPEHNKTLQYCKDYLAQYSMEANLSDRDIAEKDNNRPQAPMKKPSILGDLEKKFKEVKERPQSGDRPKKGPERS